MATHYLFGYGSLISQESRLATGRTGKAIPVRVKGLQRSWNVIAFEMRMAGVGIVPLESATCNGVLVAIEERELPAFDKREIEGTNHNYARVEIKKEDIYGLIENIESKSKIWTYVVKRPIIPTTDFPIAQSYIDVILTGCLEFGEDFAAEFVQTTQGWKYPWCNDRVSPRYLRHLKESPLERKVDEILERLVPQELILREEFSC